MWKVNSDVCMLLSARQVLRNFSHTVNKFFHTNRSNRALSKCFVMKFSFTNSPSSAFRPLQQGISLSVKEFGLTLSKSNGYNLQRAGLES